VGADPATGSRSNGLITVQHPGVSGATAAFSAGEWLILVLVTVAVLSYLGAALQVWSRDIDWPLRRLGCWIAGCVCLAATLVGPLAEQAHSHFAVHMAGHILLGMVTPLLLVSAAPVTLVLRVLTVLRARLLARALASRPVAVLAHPLIAAVLNVGGLWVLYRTGLYAAMATRPWLGIVISGHVLATGCLFVFAILGGPDPAPHRAPFAWRAGVLVAAVAAHDILAKVIYSSPPEGVPADQAQVAGELMYYAGAPVELVLITLLCRSWYRTGTRPVPPSAAGRAGLGRYRASARR
jgi:putative membrane protein